MLPVDDLCFSAQNQWFDHTDSQTVRGACTGRGLYVVTTVVVRRTYLNTNVDADRHKDCDEAYDEQQAGKRDARSIGSHFSSWKR